MKEARDFCRQTNEFYPKKPGLEGCKLLYQRGELNDHLLPVGRESIANLFDDDPDEFCPGMNAKVGSSRRKQLNDRRVAITLHNGIPIPNRDLYLYVFEMELIKEPSIEHNPKGRKFVRPEEYEHCFGFLSSVILPKLPSFPAYLRQDDMRIHIKRSPTPITFNSQKLTLIKYFHNYIFDQVLQLYKDNLYMESVLDGNIATDKFVNSPDNPEASKTQLKEMNTSSSSLKGCKNPKNRSHSSGSQTASKPFKGTVQKHKISIDQTEQNIAKAEAEAKEKSKKHWKICIRKEVACSYFIISEEEVAVIQKSFSKKFNHSDSRCYHISKVELDSTNNIVSLDFNNFKKSSSKKLHVIFVNTNDNQSTDGVFKLNKLRGTIEVQKDFPLMSSVNVP